MMHRPAVTEYPVYFARYIERVSTDNLMHELEHNFKQMIATIDHLTDEQADFRYAPEKWSLKEVVGHMIDTERIMNYRALCIARGDQTQFPGFDEDAYVRQSGFSERTLQSLIQEFSPIRQATIHLFEQFPAAAWSRIGNVNNNKITVRALGFIIAGHELHHWNVIGERYIKAI